MALLSDDVRSATIIATTATDVFVLQRDAFESQLGSELKSLVTSGAAQRRKDARKQLKSKVQFVNLDLKDVIGEGMFGPVRLAMHGPTGESFAMKVMSKAAMLARSQSPAVMEARNTLQLVSAEGDEGEQSCPLS